MLRASDSEETGIVDFDSCMLQGSKLPAKKGPISLDIDTSELDIDETVMFRIRSYIKEVQVAQSLLDTNVE